MIAVADDVNRDIRFPLSHGSSQAGQAMNARHILIVVANPAISTTLGWPVGYWAAELIHPCDTLAKAGHRVTIASPKGGKVELDAYSDPRDASGYSKDDTLSLEYLNQPGFTKLLENTTAIGAIHPSDFDAIIVAGGQSPMFTFRDDRALGDLFLSFCRAGKPSAALCHGTCLLLDLKRRRVSHHSRQAHDRLRQQRGGFRRQGRRPEGHALPH
jgi:putative intracellular protease/amidase